jgi:hypothetical protein
MEKELDRNPGFFKFVFMTIFQGFLLGIGVCAVFAIYQGVERRMAYDGIGDRAAGALDFGDRRPEAGKDYRLEDLRKIEEGGDIRIVGRITNLHATHALRGIVLQANLFQGKAFVDQYSESISLRPSETRLFKIDCGCRGNPPATHDRFEVVLVRSY